MDIAIKALGFEPFLISDEIPEGLTEYHIPGSKIVSAVATFGKFLLQAAEFDDYGWLYCAFDLKTDVTFLLTYFVPLIIARISLRGDFQYATKQIGSLLVKENQFNIFYLNEPNNALHLRKGKHILFEIVYPKKFVLQKLNFFPAFEVFKKNILQSVCSFLTNKEMYSTASIAESVYKIIHSPFSVSVQQFHRDAIEDLLSKMLSQASQMNADPKKFTIEEIERIHAAKEFIDLNFPTHFSIPQIAKHVGINSKKLKRGFKEIYGIGLYGYLHEQVLEIARIEVEQTSKSMKQISYNTGYKNANGFSAAFKKKYGLAPLYWRKQFNIKRGQQIN